MRELGIQAADNAPAALLRSAIATASVPQRKLAGDKLKNLASN